jgi:hypothetical protein
MLTSDVKRGGKQMSRRCHPRGTNETLQRGVGLMAALVTDHVQAWCPQSGGTSVLPARQLGPEIKITGREVLRTVVTLPVVGAARTHAARRTTALFKNRHRHTSLLQGGCTRQAGQAGANDGATNGRIDQLMHSFRWVWQRR